MTMVGGKKQKARRQAQDLFASILPYTTSATGRLFLFRVASECHRSTFRRFYQFLHFPLSVVIIHRR